VTFAFPRSNHVATAREGAKLGDGRGFNSPNERVRVFLAQYLTDKGRMWAEPLKSLHLLDD